jgi:AbiV family abortive infection protein
LIPKTRIRKGIRLCYGNAERLLNGAKAILNCQYVGPGSINTSYHRDLKYSSWCGLVILAIEEIGKGYFLLQKYQSKQDVSNGEWESLTRGGNAHIRKIEEAKKLLNLTSRSFAKKLNRIKQRDVYVDWKNGWQDPLNIRNFRQPQGILEIGEQALKELKCQCRNANITI